MLLLREKYQSTKMKVNKSKTEAFNINNKLSFFYYWIKLFNYDLFHLISEGELGKDNNAVNQIALLR